MCRRDFLLVRLHRVDHDVSETVAALSDRIVIPVDLLELVWVLGDQLLEDLVVLGLLGRVTLREDDDVINLALELLLLNLVFRQARILGVLLPVVVDHLVEGLAQEVEVELFHDDRWLSLVATHFLNAVHVPDSLEVFGLLLDEVSKLFTLSLVLGGTSLRLAVGDAHLEDLKPQFGVLLAVHVDVGVLVDVDHSRLVDLLTATFVLLEELRFVLAFDVHDARLGGAVREYAFPDQLEIPEFFSDRVILLVQ